MEVKSDFALELKTVLVKIKAVFILPIEIDLFILWYIK